MKLIYEIHLFCRVRPLARPRHRRNSSTYQPLDNQQEFFKALHKWKTIWNKKIVAVDKPMFILYDIYFNKPKTANRKHPTSNVEGDLDNIIKAINDGLTKYGLIKDDSLIVGSTEFMQYDNDDTDYVSIYIFDLETKELVKDLLIDKLDLDIGDKEGKE